MSEWLSGDPEQLAAWGLQATRVFEIETFVVIGSVARAAIYAACAQQAAPPLTLEHRVNYPPFDLKLRDFDGVSISGLSDQDIAALEASGKHPVDLTIYRQFFNHPEGHRFGLPEDDAMYPDPAVFKTRTRWLAGYPVRTFTIGTQRYLNNLYGNRGRPKYRTADEQFRELTVGLREQHPDEFLPDEAYAAFTTYGRD